MADDKKKHNPFSAAGRRSRLDQMEMDAVRPKKKKKKNKKKKD